MTYYSSDFCTRVFIFYLAQAFESFINRDSRAANFLSTYIDEMLRKGLKGVSEAEIDEKLDHVRGGVSKGVSDAEIDENWIKYGEWVSRGIGSRKYVEWV